MSPLLTVIAMFPTELLEAAKRLAPAEPKG